MTTRILFFCHRADRTGAPLCLSDLIGVMDRTRFEPMVLLGEDGPLVEILQSHGVEPVIIPRKRQRGALQSLGLRAKIRELKPDIVQLSNAVGWTKSAALAAYTLGIPRVWHLHDDFNIPKYRRRLPWVRRLSTSIVACSNNIAVAIPSPKTQVIPNGVPETFAATENFDREVFECENGLGKVAFRFVFVGAFMPHKNVRKIVEASKSVLSRYPDTEFLLIGGGEDPDYRRDVINRHRELELGDRVKIWTEREDISAILCASDVLILPSTRECFPRVILEASACKKPSVATPVGDIPRILVDSVNGWLIPDTDQESITNRLIEVRELGRVEASKVGSAAHATIASKYTMKRYARSFEELWEKLGVGRSRSIEV